MVGDVAALIDRSGALFPDVDPSTVALWLLAMRAGRMTEAGSGIESDDERPHERRIGRGRALMTDGVEDGTGPSAAHHDRSSACTARLSAATARWRVTASTGFESPSAAAAMRSVPVSS